MLEEDLAVADNQGAVLSEGGGEGRYFFYGELALGIGCEGGAEVGYGAGGAAGVAGNADEGADFHEAGIEGSAGTRRLEAGSFVPEAGLADGGVDGVADGKEAREEAGDVGVDERDGFIVGEGGDCSGCVAAYAGEGLDFFERGGEISGDGFGGTVEISRAGVVAEALPVGHDFGLGGCGEGFDVWESEHPALEVGDDGGDLGLLAHDL